MGTGDKCKVFIFGASGHAKVVIDIIEQQGVYEIVFLVDDAPALKGESFFGYPVIGGRADLLNMPERPDCGIVAIGRNSIRSTVASWLEANSFQLISAVHPTVSLGRGAIVGAGSVMMASAVVNSDTHIGRNVIVNTRASIDHDCVIGDNVHLAPGTTICGSVSIGCNSFICSGATVIPNLTIGKDTTVAAGATVIRDVPDNVTVAGVPASEILKI